MKLSGALRSLVRGLVKSFPTLRTLDLSGNVLEGSIPKEIGDLSDLEVLYLNDNRLTGQFPRALEKLTKLRILWLGGGNDFTAPHSSSSSSSSSSSAASTLSGGIVNEWAGSANGGGRPRGLFFNDRPSVEAFFESLFVVDYGLASS